MKQMVEALESFIDQLAKPYSTQAQYAITAGRQAIAEAEKQEPFGIWHQGLTEDESDFYLLKDSGDVSCPDCIKLYTQPQPKVEQKIVEYRVHPVTGTVGVFSKPHQPKRDVTTPREWGGLTEEEVIDLWPDLIMHKHTYQFWQNLEAKLKEKNHG